MWSHIVHKPQQQTFVQPHTIFLFLNGSMNMHQFSNAGVILSSSYSAYRSCSQNVNNNNNNYRDYPHISHSNNGCPGQDVKGLYLAIASFLYEIQGFQP